MFWFLKSRSSLHQGLEMKLPVEHIVVGNFIWYGGATSMFAWDCAAKIIKVEDGNFWVMSLDDMKEQDQSYRIEMGDHEPESRKSMRAITAEKAHEYMRERLGGARKRLIDLETNYDRDRRVVEAQIEAFGRELA